MLFQLRTGNHLLKHLLLFVFALSLLACRDEKPAGSYSLQEPPASYPTQAAASETGKASTEEAAATPPGSPTHDDVIWEHLGDWTGKGSSQTESFTGATGAFRIKWQTRAAAPGVEGTFLLTIHSAISGRPLQVAVDQRGPGADTAYVNEDPRVFFAVVEAENLEWSFSVDEAVGTRVTKAEKR